MDHLCQPAQWTLEQFMARDPAFPSQVKTVDSSETLWVDEAYGACHRPFGVDRP